MTYNTKAEKALVLVMSINPNAKKEYTINGYGKKLLNGLYLDDCQRICWQIDEELTAQGKTTEAAVTHEIPLMVFAMLEHDDILRFVDLWMAQKEV